MIAYLFIQAEMLSTVHCHSPYHRTLHHNTTLTIPPHTTLHLITSHHTTPHITFITYLYSASLIRVGREPVKASGLNIRKISGKLWRRESRHQRLRRLKVKYNMATRSKLPLQVGYQRRGPGTRCDNNESRGVLCVD